MKKPPVASATPPAPSPAPEPPEEKKSGLDKLHEEQDKRLTDLFKEDDAAPEPPKAEPPKAEPPKEQALPKVEPPKEEPKEQAPGEEKEIDFDKLPEGSEESLTKEERETAAQKRARETGQALKNLETTHQEVILERNRLKEEVEALKKSGSTQNVRQEDFLTHPEVNSIRQEILNDRKGVADTQTLPEAGQVLLKKFGGYMTDFIARGAADPSEVPVLDAKLRQEISDDFKTAYREARGDDYDESEMSSGAKEFTRDVLQLLVRNANKSQAIQEKVNTLLSKAREGTLAQNVEVYQFHETELGSAIDAASSVPEAFINDNPYSVPATVAKLMKQDAWKARFAEARKQLLELALGPRVFNQKELDDMAAGGVDVKDFNKKRQKAFLDRRKKLLTELTQALILRPLWEPTLKDAEAWRSSHEEMEILSNGKPRSSEAPAAPAVKKKASEFTSAIESHLAEAGV